ncbi:hypothetical protein L596_013598 [Steinernema carpocapsae]|uniref:Homeobox domain-containing protein n=1 Tax=Steinernema carpocapsae TaxID=34508 RepID=A0A4U5P1I3_STECR|nr:hypothetical protein L596_013598 [Steinernema carpocapsae]
MESRGLRRPKTEPNYIEECESEPAPKRGRAAKQSEQKESSNFSLKNQEIKHESCSSRGNSVENDAEQKSKRGSYKQLTWEQHSLLTSHYTANNHPELPEMRSLAEVLQVDLKRIKRWFENQRHKDKCQANGTPLAVKRKIRVVTAKKVEDEDFEPQSKHQHTKDQLHTLNEFFSIYDRPEEDVIEAIADIAQMTTEQVTNWFKSKRSRVARANGTAKKRQYLNLEQRNYLRKQYAKQKYPSSERQLEMAEILGVTKEQIRIWFSAKRVHEKSLAQKKGKDASGFLYWTVYTPYQLAAMNQSYNQENVLSKEEKKRLAKELELSEGQVYQWFYRRRILEKRAREGKKEEAEKDGNEEEDEVVEEDGQGSYNVLEELKQMADNVGVSESELLTWYNRA